MRTVTGMLTSLPIQESADTPSMLLQVLRMKTSARPSPCEVFLKQSGSLSTVHGLHEHL